METVWEYATRLLGCVHQVLAETEAGAPARQCVMPGGQVAWDECECNGGQLTVHVATDYPADTFPLQKLSGPFDRCEAAYLVVHYVITVLRCVPVQDDHGKPPPCAALSDAGHQAMQDRWALRRGVACCFEADNRLSRPPVLMQEALSVGGEGRCAGVELHVLVGFTNCVPCGAPLLTDVVLIWDASAGMYVWIDGPGTELPPGVPVTFIGDVDPVGAPGGRATASDAVVGDRWINVAVSVP